MMNRRQPVQLIDHDAGNLMPDRPTLNSRLPRFVACPVDATQVLNRLRVGVFSAGSVGRRIALHLARLGVGTLHIVDPKSFKLESLLTHDVGPNAVNQPKALLTAKECKAISPNSEVYALVGRGESLGWHVLSDLDVIIIATDRLSAEVTIGQRCHAVKKPLIHAAVHGETLTTQVRFYTNGNPDSPCPACSFGPEEWAQLDRNARFSCDGTVEDESQPEILEEPTMSVSSLCSMAADLAVNQLLRHALQLGHPIDNTLVEYCGYTNRMVSSALRRDPLCRCDHAQHEILCLRLPLAEFSINDLVRQAGMAAEDPTTWIEIGDHRWTESGACQCEQPVAVNRFLPEDKEDAGRCSICTAVLRPLLFYQHRAVRISKIGTTSHRCLKEIGAVSVPWVRAQNTSRNCLVVTAKRIGVES